MPLGFLALLATMVFGVLRQGGYHRDEFIPLAVLMAGVAIAFVLFGRDRRSLVGPLMIGAAITVPLIAATAVAAVAADGKTDAPATFALLVMVALAIAVGAALPTDLERTAITGVLLAGSIVAVTAWWGVAAQSSPWGRVTEELWRGSSSITYSNGAAALVGPLALVALARSARDRSMSSGLASFGLLLGFGATQSRGGALALLIGLVALVVVLAHRGVTAGQVMRGVVPPLLAAGVATVVLVGSASSTSDAQPLLQVGAVAVGIAITAAGVVAPPKLLVRLGAIALLVIVVAGAVNASELRDFAERRLSVSSTTTALGPDERVLFGDRAREWSEAWQQFGDEPVFGHGPGVVDLRWEDEGRRLRAIFVHNEYLELAVTHGVFGLAALLVAAGVAVTAVRRRVAVGDETTFLMIAVAVFMLHSGVDFLWHIPILPIVFATLLGLAIGPATEV